MSPEPKIDYVSSDTTALFEASTGRKARMQLLWGDRVTVIEKADGRVKVRARGRQNFGWVKESDLGGESLLELYFIDVGQGDGILIKTPNGRHLMLDGGYRRRSQDTGKNAADFVDWKFFHDYGEDTIKLDAILASHCDTDHYGGLADLLEVDQTEELNCSKVEVKAFHHAGVGYWVEADGKRGLGPTAERDGKTFLTQLIGDRKQVEKALKKGAKPALQGEWADLMRAVAATAWSDGKPTEIERLCDDSGFVPGFEPGIDGEPAIKILAPIQFAIGKKPMLRSFNDESQDTNGNSLLLSLNFKSCRILLTGDLNSASQQALLDHYTGNRDVFLCDVGKACHHGSADVSFSFLQAMNPAVTVISSGDNEGHDHPRPTIVGASAIAGHLTVDTEKDELLTPLIYSTELARSVRIGHPTQLDYKDADGEETLEGDAFKAGRIHYTESKPGSLRPSSGERTMGKTSIVSGLIYGLVNVRTDGEKILCATLDEADRRWRVETTKSRF